MMADTVEAAVNSAAQPQCQFFVVRKKRLCRMTVRPGRQYCGEHEPQPVAHNEETDLRIPCPNDPKHTCYISKLDKHLAKCNARKGEEPPYIEHNINGPDDEECQRTPLRDVPEENVMRVIEKVNTLYDKYIKGNISTFNPPAEHHAVVLEDILEAGRSDTSLRHLRQASRLLQLAEAEGLVQEDTCYIELGAGKGMLAYYMSCAWCSRSSRSVAVERAARRHKREARAGGRCQRLRADLRHLLLARAPAVRDARAALGLAKHLCGAATDYGIRCLCGAGALDKCAGALLATCCHHRCTRAAYLGGPHLQELGISGPELEIIFGIVSWATCGDGRSRQARLAGPGPRPGGADYTIRRITDTGTFELCAGPGRQPPAGPARLPPAARAAAGRHAKALLDYGRALYLNEKGFSTKMCYYVPTSESPENLCIVAKKDVL